MKIVSVIIVLIVLHPLQITMAAEGLTRIKSPVPAPDFSLKDIDGKIYRLSDYRGKVVIVSFWATWCPPCVYEMPSMNRAWKKTKREDLVILAINMGENEDAIFSFTGKYPVDFPLLLDQKAKIINQWKVVVLPTTFVVGSDGKIYYKAIGGRDWDSDKIIKMIQSLKKP